jgi:hypothetical protein
MSKIQLSRFIQKHNLLIVRCPKLMNHPGGLVLEHPPSQIREIGHEGVVVKRRHQHLSLSISLANPHEPEIVKPSQNAQDAIGKMLMTTWTLNLPPPQKIIHKMY